MHRYAIYHVVQWGDKPDSLDADPAALAENGHTARAAAKAESEITNSDVAISYTPMGRGSRIVETYRKGKKVDRFS